MFPVTGKKPVSCDSFKMNPGEGVIAVVDGKIVKAGNLKLLKGTAISQAIAAKVDSYLNEGSTVIYVAVDNALAGYIVLSDTVRTESKDMIAALSSIGVQPVLLTGDHQNAADAIAGQLAIREVHADCLPEDKLNYIGSYQEKGDAVCMIGDGINDAPPH